MEQQRTYVPYTQWKEPSIQREYTQETPLLDDSGKLIAKGWARRNLFTYDRDKVRRKGMSRKEWDFYQISDGKRPADELRQCEPVQLYLLQVRGYAHR